MSSYHSRVELTVPPPFLPKQKVKDMVRGGVEWSKQDFSDGGLPLHEAINRVRVKLSEAFDNTTLVREERVNQALDSLLERIAQFIRASGKQVSIHIGDESKKAPESLHERLVAFRACLEEDDPAISPAVMRSLLLDIAMKARDKANSIRPTTKARTNGQVRRKVEVTAPTFETDIEFILNVIGQDLVNALSP